MRTLFDPADLPPFRFYTLLTASIVPRPIAWVSTIDANGVTNLAPYSFFTVASTEPPVVQFTSVGHKDSVRNIEETGEFVINVATEEMIDTVNATSANYEPSISEFDALGVATEPSDRVRPPRVARSPIAIEATLNRVIEVGNCFVVMGDVVALAAHPDVIDEDGLPSFESLAPVSRLGRDQWGLPPSVRRITRPDAPGRS